MQVRELLTKWGFQIEHEKLDKTEKQLETIKHTLEFLAATEIIKGIYELGEKWAHFAENIHLAAVAAGLGVEEFQKLANAGELTGVSADEMSGALAKLGRNLFEARNGSQQALEIFQKVGFTQDQVFRFKNTAEAMKALADRVKDTNDPIARQAMLMSTLGRGSYNMVEFLSKGSAGIRSVEAEMGRLGVVSTRNIENLTEFKNTLEKVWNISKYVAATFAGNLVPSLNYLIENFIKLYEANKKWLDLSIREWGLKTAFVLGFIWGLIEDGIYLAKSLYDGFLEFAEAHPVLTKLGESFGVLLGSMLLFTAAGNKAISVFDSLKGVFSFLTNPLAILGAKLAIIVVGFHDIYALLTGKKTWTQGFIEWLGIADQVESVMFAIFTIMDDLLNLDFSKLKIDFLQSVKDLGSFAINTAAKFSPSISSLANASAPPSGAPPAGAAGAQTNQISAPITIHVPAGTDPKSVGKAAQEGVREHLDRIHRETQRSLRPAQAY